MQAARSQCEFVIKIIALFYRESALKSMAMPQRMKNKDWFSVLFLVFGEIMMLKGSLARILHVSKIADLRNQARIVHPCARITQVGLQEAGPRRRIRKFVFQEAGPQRSFLPTE